MKKILSKTILVSAMLATIVLAQTPYDDGQKALREQNWSVAAEQFQQAIKSDKDNADAAMYWRAHALYQAGRKAEAERQITALERKYPDSRWIKEAQVLQIENQSAAAIASNVSGDSGLDEDLRMFALAQLMDRDPERATPLVLKVLRTTKNEEIANDALFVLGMSELPAAQNAISEVAHDSSNPELQANAIHMLGAASTDSSLALLQSLYNDSASFAVKQSIIHAQMAADEPDFLVNMLKQETDARLQRDMIHALGAMDATSQLSALYPTFTDIETKRAALEAFSMADDAEMLMQVLATETEPELRKTAIHGLAMEGGAEAAGYLQNLYAGAKSKEEKTDILESLVMLDGAESFALEIVRTESDAELQQRAIEVLGVMDATAELADLYASLSDQQSRLAVLESMGISDDSSGLIRILGAEKDPQLRAAAIQGLAINGDKASVSYLNSIYATAPRLEKSAIIESMLIMDDAESLISLLNKETDPQMKREMLEVLAAMDSEAADEYLFKLLEDK